ncbi:aminotransferase, class I and II [Ketogulonicigenium vulgare Y25]|nr:aminotransferase, class I and II [Ketogulonicigenium vulgare Y25]
MDFDELIDRRNTHCNKWDDMERLFGVSPDTGIAMWVADMDFRPPAAVQNALLKMLDHGVYGYFGNETPYREAIAWWMQARHGWTVDTSDIFTTHGLVNATGLAVTAYTQPGDGVVLFTPVYHAFARTIRAAGRAVVECPLVNNAGRYEFDFAAYDAQMTGAEKMVILCSPHNPGGRVWTREELQGVADFARRHDLILVSDEIHHDLVMPGHTHIPMTKIDGIADRLVMMTAATKTFNIAGAHIGNVIISDPALKKRFADLMMGLGISPNSFGLHMVTAAYSPEGAAWVDALNLYLDGNRRLLEEGLPPAVCWRRACRPFRVCKRWRWNPPICLGWISQAPACPKTRSSAASSPRPALPPIMARPLARAARRSCALTLPRPARGCRTRSIGSARLSPTCSNQ